MGPDGSYLAAQVSRSLLQHRKVHRRLVHLRERSGLSNFPIHANGSPLMFIFRIALCRDMLTVRIAVSQTRTNEHRLFFSFLSSTSCTTMLTAVRRVAASRASVRVRAIVLFLHSITYALSSPGILFDFNAVGRLGQTHSYRSSWQGT